MIFCLFCFVFFCLIHHHMWNRPHNAQCTHTLARWIFHSLFFFLFSILFSFSVSGVCASSKSPISFFAFFFSLLPPPLHRFNSRQRTLTVKPTKSTKGRTFDTLLADSRGFLTTTSTSEGRYSRGVCRWRNFSVLVWGRVLVGVGNVRISFNNYGGYFSNHNCALYLVDSIWTDWHLMTSVWLAQKAVIESVLICWQKKDVCFLFR